MITGAPVCPEVRKNYHYTFAIVIVYRSTSTHIYIYTYIEDFTSQYINIYINFSIFWGGRLGGKVGELVGEWSVINGAIPYSFSLLEPKLDGVGPVDNRTST